jgi:hypothetical protein
VCEDGGANFNRVLETRPLPDTVEFSFAEVKVNGPSAGAPDNPIEYGAAGILTGAPGAGAIGMACFHCGLLVPPDAQYTVAAEDRVSLAHVLWGTQSLPSGRLQAGRLGCGSRTKTAMGRPAMHCPGICL